MGTPQAAVPTLKKIIEDGYKVAAVWTQPDRPSGRGNKLTASPVKEFAFEKGIPVYQPEKIKTKESIELFRSHNADVAIVVAYGRLLSKSYLSAFPNGCINVHFSLLPKYRGAAPVNWAIVNGESKTGITTMNMNIGLDTGDILLQRETEIGVNENSVELMERLSSIGAELLSETLTKLDQIEPKPQDNEEATLAPIMTKEDGLIDWDLSAKEIADRIRGFQPFPRSFTNYQDQKVTIWKAHSTNGTELNPGDYASGDIMVANGDDLLVRCGNNSVLKIEELQVEGKKRMKTRDVLNGVKIKTGEKFGE